MIWLVKLWTLKLVGRGEKRKVKCGGGWITITLMASKQESKVNKKLTKNVSWIINTDGYCLTYWKLLTGMHRVRVRDKWVACLCTTESEMPFFLDCPIPTHYSFSKFKQRVYEHGIGIGIGIEISLYVLLMPLNLTPKPTITNSILIH